MDHGSRGAVSERPGKVGLVLQGGGARGAYQVGALKAVAEITGRRRSPFQIVCGASVGAINAAPLAAASSNFQWGTRRLEALWRSLKSDAVYVTSAPTILATAFKWFWALMFSRNGAPSALLDNAPLARLLEREFDRRQLERAIRAGTLHALCITAASFSTGRAVTFFTGHGEIEEWRRARRRGVRAEIGARHLVASSSLPFIFAPVKLSDQYFGDGSLRLTAPLSPAIRAGADRLFVIAARDNLPDEGGAADAPAPTFGEMAGHALDILFNDNLDADHERLTRINNTVSLLSEDARSKTPLREIETLRLSPSQDLRDFAVRYANEMPAFIRLLMRSIGSWGKDGRLISYLLFEPGYITALIDLGYADTMARRDEVRQFLRR